MRVIRIGKRYINFETVTYVAVQSDDLVIVRLVGGESFIITEPDEIKKITEVLDRLVCKELDSGFGYRGVLLRDSDKDLIQCHICGKWFKSLSSHTQMTHKILSREYKIEFQLPLSFPLCSQSMSAAHSKRALEPKNLKRLAKTRMPKTARKKCKTLKFINSYIRSNASFHNKKGICEEQLLSRYVIVSDLVEKEASGRDLAKHDEACRAAIVRRYGSLNNFKKKHNFVVSVKPKSLTDEKILGILRMVSRDIGRPVNPKFFRKSRFGITDITVRSRFGSWNRALSKAGII